MPMMTSKELMKELGVGKSTLYYWRKEGMPHEKYGPRTVRYDLQKVKEWLRERGQRD